MSTTKLYEIKKGFAAKKGVPVYFVAKVIKETNKAVYLYGRGTTETTRIGRCMKCGRTLKHPVSVELGIGPICGGHYHDWDAIGGFTKENIERLKKAVKEIHVESWFPKGTIVQVLDTQEEVEIPSNLFNQEKKPQKYTATLVHTKQGTPKIELRFPYNKEVISMVKTLTGRKFYNDADGKYWRADLKLESIETLLDWGFEVDSSLRRFQRKFRKTADEVKPIHDIPGLKLKLRDFQAIGVGYSEEKEGTFLNADDMGLGKTVQSLAWLQLHPEKRPAIVVCPANVKYQWKLEAYKWMENPNVQVLEGNNHDVPLTGDIIIINYDILGNKTYKDDKGYVRDYPYTGWVDYLRDINPQVIIVDEIHYIKNPKAIRSRGTKQLGKNIPHRIGLSGTPIEDAPADAYNGLDLIQPAVIPSFWNYMEKFCDAKHDGWGWDFSGASNIDQLHEMLKSTIMLRRKKEDVAKELPPKQYSFVPMELDNRGEYERARSNFVSYVKQKVEDDLLIELREKLGDLLFDNVEVKDHRLERMKEEKADKVNVLTVISGLKQIATKGKLKQAVEWIRDFLQAEDKLVVFTTHQFTIDHLMAEFGDIATKIDGSITGKKREAQIKAFQENKKKKLMVANIIAGGVGLNLQISPNVAFLELPFSAGKLRQAIDRCHRIGQKAKSVNIYYLLAMNTIEEWLAELLDDKIQVQETSLDGSHDEEALIYQLISKSKKVDAL